MELEKMTFAELENLINSIQTIDSIELDIIGDLKDYINTQKDNSDWWDTPKQLIGNLYDETHSDGYDPETPELIREILTYKYSETELKTFLQKHNIDYPEYQPKTPETEDPMDNLLSNLDCPKYKLKPNQQNGY